MVIRKVVCVSLCLLSFVFGMAQQAEEFKQRKKEKKEELKELNEEIAEIKKEANKIAKEIKQMEDSLIVYPIWSKGIFGTIGFNFTRFGNWLSKKESNTAASTVGYTFNGFFNLEEKKYFWNNSVKVHQNWVRFDNKEKEDEINGFQVASDAFNVNSLWGYKIKKSLAASSLFQYRSALLQNRWNNPGNLDFGFGLSWKPDKNMVVAVHPVNYNAVFSEADLESSFGVKTIAEYSRKFFEDIAWTTNFSGFMSYKEDDLNNWVWSNGFSKTFKGIGFGLDLALKKNNQEAIARALDDNPLQWYYIFGLSYKFS